MGVSPRISYPTLPYDNDESGRHEWVISEPAMQVTVGVAMAIVRFSLNRCRELSDTNTVCQQVNWPELMVLDDSKILHGRC